MRRFYGCKLQGGRLRKRSGERRRLKGELKRRKDSGKQEPHGEPGEREAGREVWEGLVTSTVVVMVLVDLVTYRRVVGHLRLRLDGVE